MQYILLAFGWLGFFCIAAFCVMAALDWMQDRKLPFVQKMNAVSIISSIEKRLSRLSNQCEAMRYELDSYERNWVSAESFCRLKDKVMEMDSGIALSRAMQDNVCSLQSRIRILEDAVFNSASGETIREEK